MRAFLRTLGTIATIFGAGGLILGAILARQAWASFLG